MTRKRWRTLAAAASASPPFGAHRWSRPAQWDRAVGSPGVTWRCTRWCRRLMAPVAPIGTCRPTLSMRRFRCGLEALTAGDRAISEAW